METLIKALQLILSLSLLVIIHESGHFLFAKLSKTRVEKFFLFFNPWFSLFKWQHGETTYGIGWLPLGGYVKIAGMIDESMDREQMEKPAQPWEFRSKSVGQRFWIMFGGVFFNFLLAIVIFSMCLYTWGEEYLPAQNLKYGIYCDSLALDMGLQHGDKILRIGENEPESFNDIMLEMLLEDATNITVERNHREITIGIPEDFSQKILASGKPSFIMPFIPFIIDSIIPGEAAQLAGLQIDDRIIKLDTIETPSFFDFKNVIKNYANANTTITLIRHSEELVVPITINEQAQIGVAIKPLDKLFEFEKKEYGLLQSIPAGINKGFSTLTDYVKQFKLVFTREGAKQVGGFVSMGKIFPSTWDWEIFWKLTGFLSIILAFMNILPIPALDGGHIMFLLYEMVTGHKPSQKFMEHAQLIGMAILFALLIFANGNDILKLF